MSYGNYSDFLLRYKEDTSASAKVWELAEANLELSGDYYIARAANEIMKNNPEKAIEYAQQGLELDPENVSALSTFANYLHDEVKDYSLADEYNRRNIAALEKGMYDRSMMVSAYNRTAMTKYMLEQYDSSLYYVEIAIDMNPDAGYPYSTKAEAYLLMGDLNNFYKNIEIAVNKGFSLESYIDEHPYNLIKDQSKMLSIINKYKNDVALKG